MNSQKQINKEAKAAADWLEKAELPARFRIGMSLVVVPEGWRQNYLNVLRSHVQGDVFFTCLRQVKKIMKEGFIVIKTNYKKRRIP